MLARLLLPRVYGYTLACTFTPRARAASMSAITSFIFPHSFSSAILMWMMSTGTPARSPTAIASAIASNTPTPSVRMCDEYRPPCFFTTWHNATRSSVVASEPGGIIMYVERPSAPSVIASSRSAFISSNCFAVGRACDFPITHSQMLSRPT